MVLSVIFVQTAPVIPPGIGGIRTPVMATKFGFGYVSKYLVDLWTSPSDRSQALRDVWTARRQSFGLPTDHTLRPLAHRVHKGYNNQIIFDTKKIHPPENIPDLSVNLLIFQ